MRRGKDDAPRTLADVPGGDFVELDDGAFVVRFHIGDTAALSPRSAPCGAIQMRSGGEAVRAHESRQRQAAQSGGQSIDPLGGLS